MTQEEKDLVLKDLSSRLRFGVKVRLQGKPRILFGVQDNLITIRARNEHGGWEWNEYDIEEWNIKPYLRPLSSMTEKEKDYIKNIAQFKQSDGIHYDDGVHYVPIYQETLDDQWKADGKNPPILDDIYRFMLEYGYVLLIDFFNSHYLDYRGLIPMGLANEAPEGMYKIE